MKRFFLDVESRYARRREFLPEVSLRDTSRPARHAGHGKRLHPRSKQESGSIKTASECLDEQRQEQDLAQVSESWSIETGTTAMKLSVAMAAHNEQNTIAAAISQVLNIEIECEIELIVIDDGSIDATLEIARSFNDPRLTVLTHPACRGKGASVLDAVSVATGTHLLVFDADLEYSADDIPLLVAPILSGAATTIYGTRIRGSRGFLQSLVYGVGSRVTTIFANIIYGSRLRDMHTCLKLIPLPLFRQLSLSNEGFGLDTEISCELLRRKIRPFEVSCSYRPRSVAQGKQIDIWDGIECVKVILKVRLRRRFVDQKSTPELAILQLDPGVIE